MPSYKPANINSATHDTANTLKKVEVFNYFEIKALNKSKTNILLAIEFVSQNSNKIVS